MNDARQMLTLEAAAVYLGVSKTSLRRWTNDGRLSCHRIGLRNERRFDRQTLDRFLAGRNSEGGLAGPTGTPMDRHMREAARRTRSEHVGLFFRNPAEQWEGFRTFFLNHHKAGMPTIYLHNPSTREQIVERVRDEGIDPEEAIDRGLLRLISACDSYLARGAFSADYMISFVRRMMNAMRAEGFGRILLTGEMDWYFSGEKGVEEIHAYEHRLNALMDEYPEWTIVCQYDISRFDAESALDACCTHPVVHTRGRLRQGLYQPERQPLERSAGPSFAL